MSRSPICVSVAPGKIAANGRLYGPIDSKRAYALTERTAEIPGKTDGRWRTIPPASTESYEETDRTAVGENKARRHGRPAGLLFYKLYVIGTSRCSRVQDQ